MIPDGLEEYRSANLPKLEDTHIALVTKRTTSKAVKSFSDYVLAKLNENI